MLRNILLSGSGVRAGWRFLGFIAVFVTALTAGQFVLVLTLFRAGNRVGSAWDPGRFLAFELTFLAAVIIATFVMSALEKRSPTSYGVAGSGRKAVLFAEGVLWGFFLISAVVVAIWFFGGLSISGLNVHGVDIARFAVLWGVLLLLAAFSEELGFRGYPLFTLIDGAGFWPAALMLSILFGAAHLQKPGENWLDILNIVAFGIFLSFTVFRTRTIWFATGFHVGFNFFGLFVYSAYNGGEVLPGRLLQVAYSGPAWRSGGSLGPESTAFVIPILLVLWVLIARRYPAAADQRC